MCPQDSPRLGDRPLDTRDAVAGKGKRTRRRRTTAASTVRRINAKARDRHDAWALGGKPNLTERLTVELDELYGELREHRKGEPGQPYRGTTWGPQ
jgi:hypothetical protein